MPACSTANSSSAMSVPVTQPASTPRNSSRAASSSAASTPTWWPAKIACANLSAVTGVTEVCTAYFAVFTCCRISVLTNDHAVCNSSSGTPASSANRKAVSKLETSNSLLAMCAFQSESTFASDDPAKAATSESKLRSAMARTCAAAVAPVASTSTPAAFAQLTAAVRAGAALICACWMRWAACSPGVWAWSPPTNWQHTAHEAKPSNTPGPLIAPSIASQSYTRQQELITNAGT
mmetsp:Transcript_52992/g.151770  ORF Transcript_52992/g.151770 Transcript_52992/m.151770 type:complete len:235 (+) Transcript_52992:1775-2479(+)